MCTTKYVGPSCQYGKAEGEREKTDLWFCLIENPCINQKNPCMNGGTCFGRYNINGTLSTQCFCLQGYTGSYCEGS